MDDYNERTAREQAVNAFLSDVPPAPAPSRPKPITKADLATVHKLRFETDNQYDGITALAGTCNYIRGQAEETAQTVYLLIDDTTPDGADVDPMLADAYRALTRAAQLLFEAQTHLYRHVNKLQADARNEMIVARVMDAIGAGKPIETE